MEKRRIDFLDMARTFAIISIVLCHSVELIYPMNLEGWAQLSAQSKIFRTIFFTIGRLGVPIFLFITGYLILNKKIDSDEDCERFYKKNLIPLLITTETWIIIYNIFLAILNKKSFNLDATIRNMLFIEQVPLMNMWYMPMIIGIYIAIPFVNKILKYFSVKSLKFPMTIILILQFLLPTVNVLLKTFGIKQYGNILDISFLGGIYGIYIVSGYFVSKGIMKKIKNKWIILTTVVSFMLSCIIQMLSYVNGKGYNIWYNSIFLFICTLCIFELFTRINAEKINKKVLKLFTYISKISLAIFFLHIIFEKVFSTYIKALGISNPLKVFMLFTISFGTSTILVFTLSKIKIIKNKIFLVKE